MSIKFILPILLLCSACYTGKIDCPKPKDVKLKKSNIKRSNQSAAARWIKAANGPEKRTDRYHYYAQAIKGSAFRTEDNVTLEEWDCPKPGRWKYMPKQVQENIAANMAKINYELDDQLDSTRTVSRVVVSPKNLLADAIRSTPK